MIYRVIISISYCEAWYDFNTASEAGEFATMLLEHQTENSDCKKQTRVMMEIIKPEPIDDILVEEVSVEDSDNVKEEN